MSKLATTTSMTNPPLRIHDGAAGNPSVTVADESSSYNPKAKHLVPSYYHSPKFFLHILLTSVFFFIVFQIQSFHGATHISTKPSPLRSAFSWPAWQIPFGSCTQNTISTTVATNESAILERLRQSVTFLPLKDLRYAQSALVDHTWFMSSRYDSHEEDQVQFQQFPTAASQHRLLCLKGRDTHDGSWNYYALAWPDALPENATLMNGLTFVSYNHYNYDNIWHGLSAVIPFAAWNINYGGCRTPARWVLYHWGEIRTRMGPWLQTLMEAAYGVPVHVEVFDGVGEGQAVCFEEAVVMRHNEGGMSRVKREEVYDLLRCKARVYCNVTVEEKKRSEFGVTMFMRKGGRAFVNDSHVIGIFRRECEGFEGCRLQVAYADNLTVCQQVKVMSETDVLVSSHGAQLTNMFLMDKGSSVMEFFPKGWLKLAGVGQYVYHWIASWSGMRHQGAWRDPNGPPCPYPDDDRRCMSTYKNAKIGHNDTHFSEWARSVFNETRIRRLEEASKGSESNPIGCACP